MTAADVSAVAKARRVRVYVATTLGPVEVGGVLDQTSSSPRPPSVVTLRQTPVEAGCSRDFRQFLSSAGALGRAYPERSFRVEVEEKIDAGESFQLGLFLAIALEKAGRLASRGEAADAVLWATGQVFFDFTVGKVGKVDEKIALSRRLMEDASQNGLPFLGLCPEDNAADVPAAAGPSYLPVEDLKTVFGMLGLDAAAITARAASAGWRGNPYRGLETFEAEHGAIFFGRRLAQDKLLQTLKDGALKGSAFVLVHGASGSGKSSLLRAGLWNDVVEPEQDASWVRILIGAAETAQAEGSPLRALARGLATALFGNAEMAGEIEAALRAGPRAYAGEVASALNGPPAGAKLRRLLIVADPLDGQALASADAAEREAFGAALEALAGTEGVRVAAGVRGDLLDRLLEASPAFKRLATNERLYRLGSPDAAELGAIIRGPAALAGVTFEESEGRRLDDALVVEAGKLQDSLPLLELALSRLYATDSAGKVMTLATYKSAGEGKDGTGLQGIIGAFAEKALDRAAADHPGVNRADIEQAAGSIILALADLDDKGETFGRACDVAAIRADPARAAVFDALLAERLVVVAHGADGDTARLAHDSLLKHWWRAKDDVDAAKPDIDLRRHLEAQAKRWTSAVAKSGAARRGGRRQRRSKFENPKDFLIFNVAQIKEGAALANRYPLANPFLGMTTRQFIERSEKRRTDSVRIATLASAIFGLAIAVVAFGLHWTLQERGNAHIALVAERLYEDGRVAESLALALEGAPITQGTLLPQPTTAAIIHRLRLTLQTDRLRYLLKGHRDPVKSGAVSPDGRTVLTASWDNTGRLWDSNTGKVLVVLKGHEGEVRSAAFSPDGRTIVTASNDGTARLWDAKTGETLFALKGHEGEVNSAAFSPDGGTIVTASVDGTARLWSTKSGEALAVLGGHQDDVNSAVFSSDGKTVVTASLDGTARLWNIGAGEAGPTLIGHQAGLFSAVFSPDGNTILTVPQDGTPALWDANTGELFAVLRGHDDLVVAAAFSPSGRTVVTASWDGTARIWNANTGSQFALLKGHERPINSVAFSPDGYTVVTVSDDGTARLWDRNTGRAFAVLNGHGDAVNSVAFSPDGKFFVTTSDDKTARLWNANTSNAPVVLRGQQTIQSAEFSPDGKTVLTASWDNTARLWDVKSGQSLARFEGRTFATAAFSPDGKTVVSDSADNTAQIWDPVSGVAIIVLRGHAGTISSAKFSADGMHVVTASVDHTARVWNVTTGAPLIVLRGHGDIVRSAAFSADGDLIVTASNDKTASIWAKATGAKLKTLEGHEGSVWSASFSPDGKTVVTASEDGTARLWDANTGGVLAVLRGHEGMVFTASFSSDGARIVTASSDATARIWDGKTGEVLAVLMGHGSWVRSASFSPDGKTVVTASDDYTARLWLVPGITPPAEIVKAACARAKSSGLERAPEMALREALVPLNGPPPCDRVGPLSREFYAHAAAAVSHRLDAPGE